MQLFQGAQQLPLGFFLAPHRPHVRRPALPPILPDDLIPLAPSFAGHAVRSEQTPALRDRVPAASAAVAAAAVAATPFAATPVAVAATPVAAAVAAADTAAPLAAAAGTTAPLAAAAATHAAAAIAQRATAVAAASDVWDVP